MVTEYLRHAGDGAEDVMVDMAGEVPCLCELIF